MRFFLVKAERNSSRFALVRKGQCDFVAIFPVVETNDVVHFHVKSADFSQCVFNGRFFDFELKFSSYVLQVATAATSEIRASRFHSFGRRLDHFHKLGKSIVLFCKTNTCAHRLALYGKRHEHRVRTDFDDSFAFACKVRNFSFYHVSDCNVQHCTFPFNDFL